jgi:NAD(P)-dependent dehydrogenase (short-subunit alcohol dehydrogenase family)
MKLKDKVAVITGAGRGQGRAAALLFAREGASVVVAEIDAATGQETADAIESGGGKALFVQADVGLVEDCRRVISAASQAFHGVDILYNNAAIVDITANDDVDEEHWDRVLAVDLRGPFFLSQLAVREMKRRGGGAILNTSSVGALVGWPDLGCYAAAKGGLIALTKQMAIDYAADNIRVNALAPGAIDTPNMRLQPSFQKDLEGTWRAMASRYPLGRLASSDEVAQVALFLVSDDSSFITGAVIPVEGGYLSKGVLRSPYVDEGALARALDQEPE